MAKCNEALWFGTCYDNAFALMMTNQTSYVDVILITATLTSSFVHDWSASKNESATW